MYWSIRRGTRQCQQDRCVSEVNTSVLAPCFPREGPKKQWRGALSHTPPLLESLPFPESTRERFYAVPSFSCWLIPSCCPDLLHWESRLAPRRPPGSHR